MQHLLDDLDGIVWVVRCCGRGIHVRVGRHRRLLGHEPQRLARGCRVPNAPAPRRGPGSRRRRVRARRLERRGLRSSPTACGRPTDRGDGSATSVTPRSASSAIVTRDPGTDGRGDSRSSNRHPRIASAASSSTCPRSSTSRSCLPAESAGRMLYVSPQVRELLGFTQEEWLGDPIAWARQLHPEDRDRVRAIYERIETTGEPFRAEYRMYARDGSVRWFRDEAHRRPRRCRLADVLAGRDVRRDGAARNGRARRCVGGALPHARRADPGHRLPRGRRRRRHAGRLHQLPGRIVARDHAGRVDRGLRRLDGGDPPRRP